MTEYRVHPDEVRQTEPVLCIRTVSLDECNLQCRWQFEGVSSRSIASGRVDAHPLPGRAVGLVPGHKLRWFLSHFNISNK